MVNEIEEIKEIVNRETRAWDTLDVDLLMTIFHPDMVWPWPPGPFAHDPKKWIFEIGRYNYMRWKKVELVRSTQKLKKNGNSLCIQDYWIIIV